MTRGLVVPLSPAQVVARALYLAGKVDATALDEHVRSPAPRCPDLYYLLKDHNGGHDPTAPDPATRWRKPGSIFENRTVDCSGGNAWMHGRGDPFACRPAPGRPASGTQCGAPAA
jgi:hypothetical protein